MNLAILTERIAINPIWSNKILAAEESRQKSKENSFDEEKTTDQVLLSEKPMLFTGPSSSFWDTKESRQKSKENSFDEEKTTDQALLSEKPMLFTGPSSSFWDTKESRQKSKENSFDEEKTTDQALLSEKPMLFTGPSSSFWDTKERRHSDNSNTPDVVHSQCNIETFLQEGSLIWAKLTKKDLFWPAIVLNVKTAGFNLCNEDQCCVFWIKDNRVSKVPKKNLLAFTDHIPFVYKLKNNLRAQAIYESIDLFFERSFCIKLNIRNDQKLKWMKKIISDFGHSVLRNFNLEENNEKNKSVLDNMKNYGIQIIKNKTSCTRPTSDKLAIPAHMWAYIKKIQAANQLLQKKQSVQEVKKDPYNVCIGCTLTTENFHPIFNVKLCLSCQVAYIENFFLYDPSQGEKRLCALCGIYNSKYFPDKGNIWAFCTLCVSNYFPTSVIEVKKNWMHFLRNRSKYGKGEKHKMDSLQINSNWWNNLSKLFMDKEIEMTPLENFSVMIHLTCGDTGTINVKKFPPNEKNIFCFHLDTLKLNNKGMMLKMKKIISCIERQYVIMLVGSPASLLQSCWFDDNTNCNASAIEFERLFIEFYNMVRKMREISSDKELKLMWLFECPAAIPIMTQKKIKRFLNVPSLLVDTHKNIGMNRIRMIWTNIQGHETFFRSVMNI